MKILSIGTNLGNRRENVDRAIELIGAIGNVVAVSEMYETEAWGFESDNVFLNMVVVVETGLSPFELLEATQNIEREMGREVKTKNVDYADRIIDIDIVGYDDEVICSEQLIVPHPMMHKRMFVLEPLRDVAPDWIHPKMGWSVDEMVEMCL